MDHGGAFDLINLRMEMLCRQCWGYIMESFRKSVRTLASEHLSDVTITDETFNGPVIETLPCPAELSWRLCGGTVNFIAGDS